MRIRDTITKNTIQRSMYSAIGEENVNAPDITLENCSADAQAHDTANIARDSANVCGLAFGFKSRIRDPRWLLFNSIETRRIAIVTIDTIRGKASAGTTSASAPNDPIRRKMKKKHFRESPRESPTIKGIVAMIRPHTQKK